MRKKILFKVLVLLLFIFILFSLLLNKKVNAASMYSEIVGERAINVGEKIQLKAYYIDELPTDSKHALDDNAIKLSSWKSSDEKVAKVDENGVVTGISPGIVKITAKSDINIDNVFELLVKDSKDNIGLFCYDDNLNKRHLLNLNGVFTFYISFYGIPDSEKNNIIIESDNSDIVSTYLEKTRPVNASRYQNIGVNVKGLKSGKTTITASLNYKGKKYSTKYIVEVSQYDSKYEILIFEKDKDTFPDKVKKGDKIKLESKCVYHFDNNRVEKLDNTKVIYSSNNDCAVVNSDGVLYAINSGEVEIRAKATINESTLPVYSKKYKLKIEDPETEITGQDQVNPSIDEPKSDNKELLNNIEYIAIIVIVIAIIILSILSFKMLKKKSNS